MKKNIEDELRQQFRNRSNTYSCSDESIMTMDEDRFIQIIVELNLLTIPIVIKSLKGMEEATILDYCNEIKEMIELPSHSNNEWKKVVIENTIEKLNELLQNF